MSLMALWRSLWTTASSTLPGVSVMIAIQSGRIKSEWLTLSLTDQWCDCMSMIPTPMTIQHWSIPLALWSFALGTFLSTQSLGWKEGGWVVVSPSPRFWTKGSLELSWEFGVPRVKTVLPIYIYIYWNLDMSLLRFNPIPTLQFHSLTWPVLYIFRKSMDGWNFAFLAICKATVQTAMQNTWWPVRKSQNLRAVWHDANDANHNHPRNATPMPTEPVNKKEPEEKSPKKKDGKKSNEKGNENEASPRARLSRPKCQKMQKVWMTWIDLGLLRKCK